VSIATLLPLILIIGVMFLMTRSARSRQRQASDMRNAMAPGSGVRTIGGMYALVKSVNEDTVELEVAPGVVAHYAKNAVAAVLDEDEFNRVVHGVIAEEPELGEPEETEAEDAPVVLGKEAEEGAAEEGAAPTVDDAQVADLEKKPGAADAE
jgi:preprotein translocase subunit YajC